MFDITWEEKLNFLVQQDHQMRNILLEKGVLSDTYHPEMEKVHLNNARRLQEMIKKMGFPVLSNAGDKGVRLSWLIIQHAISWPDFMKECLMEMRLAAGQNDYILELLTYTEDRVAFFEGRPQLYGTNADWINGELKRTPIEDITRVDARRKSMGLPPLASSPVQGPLDRPPKDPAKKDAEFRKWLIKVGWRDS
ncbi:MAG: DUF6624 domain-containing protein [Bacteriovoracia bacterium]